MTITLETVAVNAYQLTTQYRIIMMVKRSNFNDLLIIMIVKMINMNNIIIVYIKFFKKLCYVEIALYMMQVYLDFFLALNI